MASCSPQQLESLAKIREVFYSRFESWHLGCSATNVIVTGVAWWKLNHSIASNNSKRLHRFYFLYTYVYLTSFLSIEIYQLATRYWYTGCDSLVPVSTCVWFRIPQSSYAIFFLIFKIGVLIDETLTRLWKAYKDYPHNVSIIGCVMILISMIPAAFSLPQDLNSNELQVKCSSFEHKSKFFQIFLFSGLLVAMILLAALYVFLKFYLNHKRHDYDIRFHKKRITSLGKIEHHLKTNYWNVFIIIAAFIWYTLSSLAFVFFSDSTASSFLITYTIPTASLLINILLLVKFHKNRKILEVTEITPINQNQNQNPTPWFCKPQEADASYENRGYRSSVVNIESIV